jgi:hypothetical protein
MLTLTRLMAVAAAIGLASGCVAPPQSQSDLATEKKLLQYAGPPIDSFTYLGRYSDFRVLGDKQLLVRTTVSDAYLIRVRDPCVDLRFVNRIELTSTSRTVNRQFDQVLAQHLRCRIDTIRYVDYGAMTRATLSAP